MNEPKRRGRPPKAKPELIALPVACPECGQAVGHYDDCPAGMGVAVETLSVDPCAEAAQAYANRVWHGQSHDAPRAWRIERVRLALEGQGLPFEGVVLP
jgi:hypothetical protein